MSGLGEEAQGKGDIISEFEIYVELKKNTGHFIMHCHITHCDSIPTEAIVFIVKI